MTAVQLDAEERGFYDEHGYLVVRGFFDKSEMKPWVERFLAIVNQAAERPEGMLVMRDVMVAKGAVNPRSREEAVAKIQDFQNDPILYSGYSKNPKLLDRVEAFVGPDVKSIHTMLINKPPNVDGRHPLHQDLLYFPFRPANRIVATSTALERTTRENGCLAVLPGTHKGRLRAHVNPDWKFLNLAYYGAVGVGADSPRVYLEMEPGDIVFFHPLLVHGSGRNRTQGFRRTILTHYASADCRFLPGGKAWSRARPYLLVRGKEHAGCI